MKKRAAAAELKVKAEEKKPKIVAKHETSEEEESESEEEPEEVEVSDNEQVNEDDEEEVEYEEVEEEVEVEEEEEEEEEKEEDEDQEEEEEEEEEDESSKKETLRKLLEPLPKEKIIEFLKEAALKDPSIVATLTQTAEVDPAHRRIFVFGLRWDATTDQLLSAFKQYGDIEECTVVKDKITGKAKGYGFVLFKTRKSAQKSLKQTQKKIGGRMATCQLASAGPSGPNNNQTATTNTDGRKIFVANVASHVDPNSLKSLFAQFGEIEHGPSGMDRTTGKFKGFAMFVYKTVEGCKKALEEPNKVFDGCQLQCRQAVDGQRGNKNAKTLPSAASNVNIGNMGFGYGVYAPHLMNSAAAAAGVMAGQNPMLVSALNQNSISSTPQSFGLGAGYGMNTVSPSMMANYGLGAYQHSQVGSASAAGTTPTLATRQQPGIGSLDTLAARYL